MEEKRYMHAEVKDEVLHIEVRNLNPETMALIASNLIGVLMTKPGNWQLLDNIKGVLNGSASVVGTSDPGN